MSRPMEHDTPQAVDICAEEGHVYATGIEAYFLWKDDVPNDCQRCGHRREP